MYLNNVSILLLSEFNIRLSGQGIKVQLKKNIQFLQSKLKYNQKNMSLEIF